MITSLLNRLFGWGAPVAPVQTPVEASSGPVAAPESAPQPGSAVEPVAVLAPPQDQGSAPAIPTGTVRIHKGVLDTMFEDFQKHKETDRGEEETGWMLLGRREAGVVIIEAALPPGEFRDAGTAHVNVNSTAISVAMRVLKKSHPRLDVIGMAHTHPGSLDRPSEGDYRGDIVWVRKLPGRQGVFAIGVWEFDEPVNFLDDDANQGSGDVREPVPPIAPVSCFRDGRSRFNWFSLSEGDGWYKACPMEPVAGDDFGQSVRQHWEVLEHFAGSIDRLLQMQPGMRMGLLPVSDGVAPAMVLCQPLARDGEELQVVLQGRDARFFRMSAEEIDELQAPRERLDTAFFEVMAELTRGGRREARAGSRWGE